MKKLKFLIRYLLLHLVLLLAPHSSPCSIHVLDDFSPPPLPPSLCFHVVCTIVIWKNKINHSYKKKNVCLVVVCAGFVVHLFPTILPVHTEYFFGSVFSEDFQTYYNISTEFTLYNDSFKKREAGWHRHRHFGSFCFQIFVCPYI